MNEKIDKNDELAEALRAIGVVDDDDEKSAGEFTNFIQDTDDDFDDDAPIENMEAFFAGANDNDNDNAMGESAFQDELNIDSTEAGVESDAVDNRLNQEFLRQEFDFLDENESEIDESGDDDNDNAFGSFAEVEDFKVDGFKTPMSAEIQEVGKNWLAIFGLIAFLGSAGGLLFAEYQQTVDAEKLSRLETLSSELDADLRELGHQALLASMLASNGEVAAFVSITNLKSQIDFNIALLKSGDEANQIDPIPIVAMEKLTQLEVRWSEISPHVDLMLANQQSGETVAAAVTVVNELSAKLLEKTENVITELINSESNIDLIVSASRQRFITERMRAKVNEFAAGQGAEAAIEQFDEDVNALGQAIGAIGGSGGVVVANSIEEINPLYDQLEATRSSLMDNVAGFNALIVSADGIAEGSNSLKGLAMGLQNTLMGDHNMMAERQLSLLSGFIVVLSFLVLISAVIRHNKKITAISNQRTQVSEGAIIKLLDEIGDLAQGDLRVETEVADEITGAIADSINFAVAEMRGLVIGIKSAAGEMYQATEGTEKLIANLLTSSDNQSQEILSTSEDVSSMTEAINQMSELATRSSQQAQVSVEVAQRGSSAVHNTILGMNTARNQIQETAKQLKRLGESSQQINEIVNLIQNVAEQTNVLSLNASIQAAMAGEAGRGFAVVADEVQRLAERSARASNDITELVKNIQQDANSAIASMESTTEEVVSGATTADEAGRALGEIEEMSQNLLGTIQTVAGNAEAESKVAQSVSDRMKILQKATTDADLSVSQVAVAIEKMGAVVDRLNQSIAGFKLPENS